MLIDVAAFQPGTPLAQQALATETDNGQTVTGPAKLAQRFVLELLTDTNSVPGSTQGCSLVQQLSNGVATETDVFLAIHMAIGTVIGLMQAAATPTDPPDELIASVSVDKLLVADSSLSAEMTLTTQAGSLEMVTLPLNFVLGT